MENITEKIIGCAIKVHQELGPGLLESTYEKCFVHELLAEGLFVEVQKELPVFYRGVNLECGYRIDILVNREVVVELKSVDAILPIHQAQILSYLKLSGCKIGLLINFNVTMLKQGIRRLVNNF
ncbi:GxxExxY protein [Geoalkalibacter ferrihydriticus]|uniref:GxxExxY protein n=2 Tax=Geoalkalibacter ferrihydriticus TaxID=392333 RepID=A0A0C2HEX0_9BACT|nr:GxxExxY protein [Geoalkalibacter ferrihydriticus]KIH75506.1 GxxExxY protein [Geoalkalibacter ferrihydriticus DSM 17813]SDM87737.1 GxxExxY protein [Geoalkalibacter ferrihydriticus]